MRACMVQERMLRDVKAKAAALHDEAARDYDALKDLDKRTGVGDPVFQSPAPSKPVSDHSFAVLLGALSVLSALHSMYTPSLPPRSSGGVL